jgi:stage II sporulation protein D
MDLRALRFEARRGPLRVGARDYIGALEIWRQGEGLLLINEVPMEEYVAGTVRGEASERWPAEALRALAVVARTYAVFHQNRSTGRVFHLVSGNQDQNYIIGGGRLAREAARTTAGQVLTGRAVCSRPSPLDSGGFTEAPQSVFSGTASHRSRGPGRVSTEPPSTPGPCRSRSVIGERLRRTPTSPGHPATIRCASFRVARMAVST